MHFHSNHKFLCINHTNRNQTEEFFFWFYFIIFACKTISDQETKDEHKMNMEKKEEKE